MTNKNGGSLERDLVNVIVRMCDELDRMTRELEEARNRLNRLDRMLAGMRKGW